MKNKILLILTILAIVGFKPENADKHWVELKDGEKIDDYYLKDNKIFCGEAACNIGPMKGINVETFRVWPGSRYAKDTSNVYYPIQIMCVDYSNCGVCYCQKFVVENAEPLTFRYLDKDYAMDDNSVYFRGEQIKLADAKSFKVIKGGKYFYFAVDNNNVYRQNFVFKNADPATFYYDSLNAATNEWTYIIGDKLHKWKYTPPGQIEKVY